MYRLCFFILCATTALAQQPLTWTFPVKRPHAGLLLANGTQGIMVWGEANTLKITVGRAGFWDHRGGNAFATRTTFQDVKKLLYAKDEAGINAAFAIPKKEGSPTLGHPQQIGGGRLEITLPVGTTLRRGVLSTATGEILIYFNKNAENDQIIRIKQAVNQELTLVEFPRKNTDYSARLIPSWESVKGQLLKVGVKEPLIISQENIQGFVQTLPQDDPLGMAFTQEGNQLFLATALASSAKEQVISMLKKPDFPQKEVQDFWKNYWANVPKINLPDPILQEIIDYGLYKQACSTPPQGLPCALQGPFNEEYQLPPWSNDYHFNINIEMIYTPALASNRLAHLQPLWKMIDSWMPQLKSNGEAFFGRKGALMLPHAVDDRCQVVGTFWTGTIDHACTAWMAYLAWQQYKYGMDKAFLEKTAWPLLEGAFEGYWAMLEEKDGRLSLPISVSPEYGGSSMKAWGRDASFQLAALHRIARIMPQAAQILGQPQDARWEDVQKRLPPFTTIEGTWMEEFQLKGTRIALWEGQDLVGSHRHHAHLAGLYPFATIDHESNDYKQVVNTSLKNWTFKGPGAWSGWCVPWASAIWSRMNKPEAASMWLHYWKENFTNEGRGTLHNAAFVGSSLIADESRAKLESTQKNREIMQLDAGFGALSAVFEMLVQQREDVLYVLPSIHHDWQEADFQDILSEGAFLISAKVRRGKAQEIRVRSLVGGTLKLAHGLGEKYKVNDTTKEGTILVHAFQKNEEIVLTRLAE